MQAQFELLLNQGLGSKWLHLSAQLTLRHTHTHTHTHTHNLVSLWMKKSHSYCKKVKIKRFFEAWHHLKDFFIKMFSESGHFQQRSVHPHWFLLLHLWSCCTPWCMREYTETLQRKSGKEWRDPWGLIKMLHIIDFNTSCIRVCIEKSNCPLSRSLRDTQGPSRRRQQ